MRRRTQVPGKKGAAGERWGKQLWPEVLSGVRSQRGKVISRVGLVLQSPWLPFRLRSWTQSTDRPPARGFVTARARLRQDFITKIVSILLLSY